MLAETEIEIVIKRISLMDKPALIAALGRYRAEFPTDLTSEFLAGKDEVRLRHLLAALCLHCGVIPEDAEAQRDAA